MGALVAPAVVSIALSSGDLGVNVTVEVLGGWSGDFGAAVPADGGG